MRFVKYISRKFSKGTVILFPSLDTLSVRNACDIITPRAMASRPTSMRYTYTPCLHLLRQPEPPVLGYREPPPPLTRHSVRAQRVRYHHAASHGIAPDLYEVHVHALSSPPTPTGATGSRVQRTASRVRSVPRFQAGAHRDVSHAPSPGVSLAGREGRAPARVLPVAVRPGRAEPGRGERAAKPRGSCVPVERRYRDTHHDHHHRAEEPQAQGRVRPHRHTCEAQDRGARR